MLGLVFTGTGKEFNMHPVVIILDELNERARGIRKNLVKAGYMVYLAKTLEDCIRLIYSKKPGYVLTGKSSRTNISHTLLKLSAIQKFRLIQYDPLEAVDAEKTIIEHITNVGRMMRDKTEVKRECCGT